MLTKTTVRRESDDGGDPILTKAVKAGRRTYFFDVRATRNDDYFLTITESRKSTAADGSVSFDRHKLYLYKEDLEKFSEALGEVAEFIREKRPLSDTAEM